MTARRAPNAAHEVPTTGTPKPAPAFAVVERGRNPDGSTSKGRWVLVLETVHVNAGDAVRLWRALRTPAQQASVFWRVIPVHVAPGWVTTYRARRTPPGARA